MNSERPANVLHKSWAEPQVSWIPSKRGSNYAEQLITASIDAATNEATEGQAIESGSAFPWGFVEVSGERLKTLARSTSLSVDACLTMLGADLVRAVRENSATPEQLCLDLNLRALNPQVLRVLATGQIIEGQLITKGTQHGRLIPPWARAGPCAPIIEQFARCVAGLKDYTDEEFAIRPVTIVHLAWAAYVEPTVLLAPANDMHPAARNGVIPSAVGVANGSMADIKRSFQARETWERCRQLGAALQSLDDFTVPSAGKNEVIRFLADEYPDREKVESVLKCLEHIIRPAWQQQQQIENHLYPVVWTKQWGQYPVALLEALRNAGAKGIETKQLRLVIEKNAASVVTEMRRSKRPDKARMGMRLKKLRDQHNDGRYYLY